MKMTNFSFTPRAVFLRLVSLAVLLYTLWSRITCNVDGLNGNCTLCEYNYNEFQVIILLDVMHAVLIFIFQV